MEIVGRMKSEMTPMDSPLCTAPIFILGIHGRSGTNFLADLLCLHPDCGLPAPIMEDYLVHHTDLLVRYTKSVYWHWSSWKPPFEVDESFEDLLCQSIGNGLISFLTSQINEKRLVTKTPSVGNLRYFFKLFPQAYLLILVRDGRAVVESSVKSFGWDYEETIRKWADAARTILDFDGNSKDSNVKYMIVRYEDLYSDTEEELRQIFAFLDLETETYNLDAAMNLPVKGSSAFHGQGEKSVHWEPIEKTSDFKPLERWSHWDRALHERFNWIAGQYLLQFGYEEKQYPTNRLLWAIYNRALDTRWRAKVLGQSLSYRLKRKFGIA